MTAYEQRIRYLLGQYAGDKATEPEIQEMIDLLQAAGENPELESFLMGLRNDAIADDMRMPDRERLWRQVQYKSNLVTPVQWMNWRRIAVAAAVLLFVGIGSYMLLVPNTSKQPGVVTTTVTSDIKSPATNRAAITLANGKTVFLDSAVNGTLATQENVQVVKLGDGRIEYRQSSVVSRELSYNTLSNPRGSKIIDMVLADGSQVWLNAGSSVTYPVAFVGNERKVSVTGEAYFEVAHDAAKPFIVNKGDMSVQVLGTHFNVNAYDDEEEIKVTLLEGSVRVKSVSSIQGTSLEKARKSKSNEVIIKPGEQASISEIRDPVRVIRAIHVIHDIDIEQVMAWKNGLFSFKQANIKTVMRELARWYDMEVEYTNPVTTEQFGGKVQRNLNLSEVLDILKTTGVHYKIEGKKLKVLP